MSFFVVVFALVLAGCSSGGPQADAADGVGAPDVPVPEAATSSTTTTAPQLPPEILVSQRAFAFVGDFVSDAIVVDDPNGDDVVVRSFDQEIPGLSLVTNVRGRIIGFEWEPTEPGEWDVEFTATDPTGLTDSAVVNLVARNEPTGDTLLAMGDSIAAGFGRDRSDFAGNDGCFRSEENTYAAVTFEDLIDAGALEPSAELLIVACAGVGTADLATQQSKPTNGSGQVIGEPMTQLARATAINPTIVTLTVGSADAGLFGLEDVLVENAEQDAARAVDMADLLARTDAIRRDLQHTFEVLLTTTDAHVALTTAYNPVASNPVGIDGCNGECMVEASNMIADALNAVLLEVAAEQPEGRVSVARLDGDADVWEAPNGAGLDAFRDGLGPLQGLVDTFTGGSNALCADDGGVDGSLVSRLDCAHPNADGQRAIAEVVTRELLSI